MIEIVDIYAVVVGFFCLLI